jgi:hypothetical protein
VLPVKGSSETGALGRHVGSSYTRFKKSPGRLGKDRPKESHDGVVSERLTPNSQSIPKWNGRQQNSAESVKKQKRSIRPGPHQDIDKYLNRLIDGGKPPNKRPPEALPPRVKVKFQKWDLSKESWNFKRSPSLTRLKKSLRRVIEGNNAFYKFKSIFRNVKITTPERYNRCMSILYGGLIVSTKPIGIGIVPPIRKVRKLSFQDLEFLISKLPFWATSYRFEVLFKLASAISSSQPVGKRSFYVTSPESGFRLRAPYYLRGAYNTTCQLDI